MPTTLVVLDLLGISVFAISGALVAVRKDFDLMGALVLAGITALGGGFLRDVLIGATPAAALTDWRYLVVPAVAGAAAFWFHQVVDRFTRPIAVFDALGLSLFCVAGALKATQFGLGPLAATILGAVSAIGGGILRDVVADTEPAVFSGPLYASPALLGAGILVVAVELGAATDGREAVLAAAFGALACLVLRLAALARGWGLPKPPYRPSTRSR